MAHIDPIGFIALLLVGFGWGRPVEIDPRVFKKPRRDELLVSVAGVIMNLILAVLFAIALGIFIRATGYYPNMGNMGEMISLMLYYCIYINLVLMVFNLLPIPPLDGFNVVTELFDLRRYDWWLKIAESMSKMREENYLKAWFSRIDSLASWTKVISIQYRE